jgi:pimeloyl-ACP methyl ester carboxylesterase
VVTRATTSDSGSSSASERIAFHGGSLSLQRQGDGTPLLFLHDGGGASQWHGALAAWSRHHDVIVPDHPGFGASDALDGIDTVTDLVYLYLDLLDRLKIQRPHLAGGSFGGWIAAELAVHSPERFASLSLLSPVGLRIAEQPIADLFLMGPDEVARALYHDDKVAAEAFPPSPSVEHILRVYRDMGALALFAWAPFMANPKLEQRLHRVRAPTLVLWPEHDRVVPRAHAEHYASRIPGARLEIVKDCGHAMYYERPEPFATLVGRFLQGIDEENATKRATRE